MNLVSFGEVIWDVYPNKQTLGGAPLNFAAHAALQGCDSLLLSSVGDDALGAQAIKKISALGVRASCIDILKDYPTGKCLVSLNENGVPSYNLLSDVAYDHISVSPALPEACDVLAFGTLALRGEENRATLTEILKKLKANEIFTDINIRPPFYSKESIEFCLSRSTIVKISDEELPTVTREVLGEVFNCETAATKLSEKYPQIKLLIITKGENGSLCYEVKSKKTISAPAERVTAVSTVGAGDSFGATFLAHYMKTGDIADSLRLASKVSAFVVSRQGAIPDDTKEFLESIKSK